MIFDIHTHCFKDSLAKNAIQTLSAKAGILAYTNGTLDDTVRIMDEAGVYGFAVLNISVSEHQQKNVNDYAISINNGRVVAFGSVHPFSQDAISEIDRLKDNGVKGLKFHNEYQNFDMDDERAYPVYEYCFNKGLVILFHGGRDLGFNTPLKASPKRALNVAKTFPKAEFIMAHFGGYGVSDDVIKYLQDTKVQLDTSFTKGLDVKKINDVIRAFGTKRIYFGSDTPWVTPKESLEFIYRLKLTDEERVDILYNNAKRLLELNF